MDSSDSDTSLAKKSFKCTFSGCNAAFSRNFKLIIHLRKHTNERPFVCDEPGCDKTYTNNAHLRRHKNVSHGEKTAQVVTCDYEGCGAVLANKYSLKKHCSRKHNPEQYPYPFKCSECSQGFERKKQLQQHVYLHTGEAAFNCDKCDMSFTTSYILNKHKRSHRVYTCECGEIFHRWSRIRAHRKSCKHPRFTCEICDKTFSHITHFKKHQLMHKDKPEKMAFVCPYKDCKRFYLHKRNLKSHIDTFHKRINEGKTFKCTYPKCEVVLKTKRLQKLHLLRHFEWKKKKKRKIRCDKGKPKKSMLSMLVSKDLNQTQDEREEIVTGVRVDTEQITTAADTIEEDPILKQCEMTLKLLNEQMVAVN